MGKSCFVEWLTEFASLFCSLEWRFHLRLLSTRDARSSDSIVVVALVVIFDFFFSQICQPFIPSCLAWYNWYREFKKKSFLVLEIVDDFPEKKNKDENNQLSTTSLISEINDHSASYHNEASILKCCEFLRFIWEPKYLKILDFWQIG